MARAANLSGSRSAAGRKNDPGAAEDKSGGEGSAEPPLDARIDQLYQLPLDAFTNARNALAKSLAAGGDKSAAAQVKALSKPTVIPWAVNQVYWQAPSIWARLMEAGEALRAAQVEALERPGNTAAQAQRVRDQLREATAAHRQAVADAVHQAVRAAAQAEAHPQPDTLARMLDAVSLAPPAHPGRLTEVVQPAGFEALLGVSPVPAPPLVRPPAGSQAADRTSPDRSAGARPARAARGEPAEAAAERRRAEEWRAAQVAVGAAHAAEKTAVKELEDAQAALEDAELRVTQAKATVKTAGSALKAATAARAAAEADLRRLEQRK